MLGANAPLFVLFAVAVFLLYQTTRPARKRPYADVSDAKAALNAWMNEHDGIHPGDYPSGKRLTEAYRRVLLELFAAVPRERDSLEYGAEYAYVEYLLAPRRSGTFHAIA